MKQLRKTKIVGTIGPASENKLEELFEAGLNVTRVNYSHGSWDEQSEKKVREKLNVPVALLLDMKGPEIRTGMLYTGKNKKIELKDGQKFTLFNEDIEGNEEGVSVTYKELYKDVQPGTKILIDDGAIELKVDEVVGKDIVTTVVHGNGLGSRKTMNLPGTVIRLPGLAEKDIADLKTACEHDYDFVAISFARNLDDIRQVRKVLDENGGKDIQIITKIENVEGLSNLDDILREADAIYMDELRKAGLYREIWQAFATLPDVKTVGVMGDERTYAYLVGLRAVSSSDGMTSDWYKIPYDVLEKIANRIVNEVDGAKDRKSVV